MNIAFYYIYRDGANYKNFNKVIFENDINLSIDQLKEIVKSNLIGEEYFYTNDWQLPDLHFGTWDNEIDHTWHEFESIEYTNEVPNTVLNIRDFISAVKKTKSTY